jgi:hypothetical protein
MGYTACLWYILEALDEFAIDTNRYLNAQLLHLATYLFLQLAQRCDARPSQNDRSFGYQDPQEFDCKERNTTGLRVVGKEAERSVAESNNRCRSISALCASSSLIFCLIISPI